jgi:hypothetical protein
MQSHTTSHLENEKRKGDQMVERPARQHHEHSSDIMGRWLSTKFFTIVCVLISIGLSYYIFFKIWHCSGASQHK